MTSILDIDLDYFNLFDDPLDRLNELLDWANRPVDKVVDIITNPLSIGNRLSPRDRLPPRSSSSMLLVRPGENRPEMPE